MRERRDGTRRETRDVSRTPRAREILDGVPEALVVLDRVALDVEGHRVQAGRVDEDL